MNHFAPERRRQLAWRSTIVILLALCITLWGLAATYHTQTLAGTWNRFLTRQALWALLALLAGSWLGRADFEKLFRQSPLWGAIAFVLLAALPFAGTRINGMCGWYSLGGVTVQPSELAKGFYLLWLIRILTNRETPPGRRFFRVLLVMAAFLLCLLCQPDFGTALIYAAGTLAALFVTQMPMTHLAGTAALLAAGAGAALWRFPYMRGRIVNFWNPAADPGGGGWHLHQFAIAVARGGWFGIKSDMAVWSAGFLPLSHNDSAFAAMCELLGFCGAALLLVLYAVWFYQLFMLAAWRRDPVRRAFIESVALMLLAQTALHVLVNLGLLPPTGVTLPLVSYGGSSLVGTMLMLGLALSAAGE